MGWHKLRSNKIRAVIMTATGMTVAISVAGAVVRKGGAWMLEAHAISGIALAEEDGDDSDPSPMPIQSEAIPDSDDAFVRADYRDSPEMTLARNLLADGMAQHQEAIDISGANLQKQFVSDIYHSVLDEEPGLWYVGGSGTYTVSEEGLAMVVRPDYMPDSPEGLDAMRDEYERGMQEIVSEMPEDATEMDRIRLIHDRIIDRCSYNYDCALDPEAYDLTMSDNPYGAYSAVVMRKSVCRGYALAFKDACQRIGIECEVTRTRPHEWNKVRYDGHWYNVDLTFDDLGDGKGHCYDLFMKSDGYLRQYDAISTSDNPHANPFPEGFLCDDDTYDSLGMGILRVFS